MKVEDFFFSDGEPYPFCARDVSIIFKNQLHIAQSDSSNMNKWSFISLVPELLLAELSLEEINNIITVLSNSTNFRNILTFVLSIKFAEANIAFLYCDGVKFLKF